MNETQKINEESKSIAFAMGGLGGNNAFGAGFLQAALDKKIKPELITCTSGQIWWVYQYIKAIGQHTLPPDYLRKELENFIKSTEPFGQHDWNLLYMGLHGKPGMMRTAFPEFMLDMTKNTISVFERVLQQMRQGTKLFLTREVLSELPVRQLIPCFPERFFIDISDTFNQCEIGIAFNSYDPIQGMEIVHLNDKAKQLLGKNSGDRSSYRTRTIYKDIEPEYVRQGLWVLQYGFEDSSIIDGCYFRGVMLSEATIAEKIFISRPLNRKWIGKLPTSYIENEDLKIEIFFNGSYQAEYDKIELINTLIGQKIITHQKYHKVELNEVEIETQRGFFDYIFEDINVFDRARTRALLLL